MTHWTKAELESNHNPKWKREGKRRLRARKKEFVITALGGKCASCGTTEGLELDHMKHDRSYTGGFVSKSWAFIKAELAKGAVRLLCRSENASDGVNHYWRTRAKS